MKPYDELIERMKDSDFETHMRKHDELTNGLSEARKYQVRKSMVEETLRNDDRVESYDNNYEY